MSEDRASVAFDPNSHTPRHAQIAAIFRAEITDRILLPGDGLPTEAELQERFGVSRSVARQAMLTLAAEGLIVRGRGRGSIVAPQRQYHRLAHRAAGLSAQAAERGLRTGARVVSFAVETKRPEAAAELTDGPVHRLERVRTIDDVPVAVIRTWLPSAIAARLSVEELTNASLHDVLADRFGIRMAGGERQVRAVPADEHLATLLHIHPGAPLLLLEGTTTDSEGKAAEVFSTWHRGDLIALDVEVEVAGGRAESVVGRDSGPRADPLNLARQLVATLEDAELNRGG